MTNEETINTLENVLNNTNWDDGVIDALTHAIEVLRMHSVELGARTPQKESL